MDRSLKWRTLSLLALIVLCVCVLMPTVRGDQLPGWFPFHKKINLGLDLQGGSHIVYSIDLDKAIDDRASAIKRDLDTQLVEDKLDATVLAPSNPVGALTVIPKDPAKRAEIAARVNKLYDAENIESRDCAAADKGAICFRVATKFADKTKKAALENAVTTIRDRIDENGVAEPSVVQKGDEIIVELPGLDAEKKTRTRDDISRAAKLEFKVVAENNPFSVKLFNHVGSAKVGKEYKATDPAAQRAEILAEVDQWKPDGGGAQRSDYFLLARTRPMALPLDRAKEIECVGKKQMIKDLGLFLEEYELLARSGRTVGAGLVQCPRVEGRTIIRWYLEDLVAQDPSFAVPEGFQLAYEEIEPSPEATDKRSMWRTYLLERAIRLTGTSISNARGSYAPDTGRPIVLIDFDRYGSRVFGNLTEEIKGRKLATILDDKVKSAPIINGAIRGGSCSIRMGGSDPVLQEKERDGLVNVLKTGSLPAPLREETVSDVGPTLGRDAIDKTKLSFGLGILLVVLIMVGVYRWSGWIAVFAVVFHNLLTLAVMATFGATLTLPGIAAIVLSIGMTVDGNILIYERIRDELLLGKSVRGAVDLGFSRAFSAILDGQATTAAAGWVLLQYGSGPIKGFAVLLLVGVFTTVTTNIWVTRVFFDWYIARKKGHLATISI